MAKRVRKFGGGRTRLLEELGRVEAEPSNRNRRAEISRVHGELNKGYAKGGTAKGQGNPKIGRPKNPRDKWRDRIKNMGKRPSITDILSGGREGKPHSSKEGRKAAAGRAFRKIVRKQKPNTAQPRPMPTPGPQAPKRPKWGRDPRRTPGRPAPKDPRSPYIKDRVMTPLRAKKAAGGIIKKIITKFKPKPKSPFKPKPVPKAVTDVDKPFKGYDKSYTRADDKKMDAILKKLGDEIKAQPLPPKLKETMKKLQKAYPHKKAKGGRISRGHGGSAAQQHYLQHGYGPTKAKLRAGKPKIAKKGWA